MNKRKNLFILLILLVVLLVSSFFFFINLREDYISKLQNNSNNQIGYEEFKSSGGSGGNSKEISDAILQQIKQLSGVNLKESDLPISYGLPVFPESYREKLLEKMISINGYRSKEININTSTWNVYDVSNSDFKEFYHQSSVSPYYKNGVRLFIVNKSDKKFISISQRVTPKDEDLYLQALITLFQKSQYYKNYPLMEVNTLEPNRDFGHYTQYTFFSLYNSYRSKVVIGRTFDFKDHWEMDYEGSPTYYEFINNKFVESGSTGEVTKKNILNNIKKNE